MIRRPPRSTLDRSSAASDVYKRQQEHTGKTPARLDWADLDETMISGFLDSLETERLNLSLIHISEPTRPY